MKLISKHLPTIGLLMLTTFVAAAAYLYWDVPARLRSTPQAAQTESKFACPMHPEVTSAKAGRCSKCGMSLVSAAAIVAEHAGCMHAASGVEQGGCAHSESASGGGCCGVPELDPSMMPALTCTRSNQPAPPIESPHSSH
jgi:hypothetical protein